MSLFSIDGNRSSLRVALLNQTVTADIQHHACQTVTADIQHHACQTVTADMQHHACQTVTEDAQHHACQTVTEDAQPHACKPANETPLLNGSRFVIERRVIDIPIGRLERPSATVNNGVREGETCDLRRLGGELAIEYFKTHPMLCPFLSHNRPFFVRLQKNAGAVHLLKHRGRAPAELDAEPIYDCSSDVEMRTIIESAGAPLVRLELRLDSFAGIEVFADQAIEKDMPIIEGLGLVRSVADHSGRSDSDAAYAYQVNERAVIDASTYGNEARFFNCAESQDVANVIAYTIQVKVDGKQLVEDRLIFYASRKIIAGEAMRVFYSVAYLSDADVWFVPPLAATLHGTALHA
jgi:hypothetical protein